VEFQTIAAMNMCGELGKGLNGGTTIAFDQNEILTDNAYSWDTASWGNLRMSQNYTQFDPAKT
jgi:hypothetical protein